MTNRKSNMRFRLVPKSTTLDDLEGPLRIVSKHVRLSEPTTKIWMKIDPYCQRRRCSPITLDSGNIRFMRIFVRVPWKGGVIQQWGNRKRVFSGFRTLRIRHLRKWGQHYYVVLFSPLSPFHLTPKYVTLNDLEWLLNGHFTLYVHYYELPLVTYLLSFVYYTCNQRMWPAKKCGKRSSKEWS